MVLWQHLKDGAYINPPPTVPPRFDVIRFFGAITTITDRPKCLLRLSLFLFLSRKNWYVELEVVDVWFVLNLVVDQLSSPHVSFFYNVLTFWISYLAEIQHGEDKYWT